MLADTEIRAALRCGDLKIYTGTSVATYEPVADHQIQPVSVDLRLGGVAGPLSWWDIGDGGHSWLLPPGQFMLASTLEVVDLPHTLAGVVAGKSSVARRGLQVEAAGLVDPGFRGQLTLELIHFGKDPVLLDEGMPICQLYLHRVDGVVERPYGSRGLRSRYQGQMGPTGHRPDPDEEGPTA